jgi:surface protein
VHVIDLLVFATVFMNAIAFNGDLNQWDVTKVTDMSSSKSIRILENDGYYGHGIFDQGSSAFFFCVACE